MTSGVAVARQRTKTCWWIPFRFPDKIRMLSRTKGERGLVKSIGLKIRKKCHLSATRSKKEVIPYLKIIFQNNPEMAVGLSNWLELEDEMIEYLAESKKQTKAIIAKLDKRMPNIVLW